MIQKRLLFLRKLLKSFKEFVAYVLSDGGVVEAREYLNSQMKKAQNASILQIPSAFKTSVLYNQIPINPSEDFDVVRNSDVWRTNESGYYENIGINVPCIDYTDGFPVLLTQPQSTNFLKNSSTLSLQAINNAGIVTDNAAISPEGIQNAAIYETDGLSNSYVRSIITFTSTGTTQLVTFSYHVKYIDNQWLRVRVLSFNEDSQVRFDILNGVIGTNEFPLEDIPKIEPLKDGWYRISVTKEFDFSTDRSGSFQIQLADGDNTNSQTAGKQIALYEPQAEELGYATTPIKTGAAVVSRLKDEITGAGSVNTINSEEGVLVVNSAYLKTGLSSNNTISIGDGTNNRIVFKYDNINAAFAVRMQYILGGVLIASEGTEESKLDKNDFNVFAISWGANNIKAYLNGFLLKTEALSSTFTPNTLTSIYLNEGGVDYFFGKLKELRVYKSIAEAQIDLPYIS